MKFTLPVHIEAPNFTLKHGDGIILLGSCFSDNLVEHFVESGFRTESNPFGTVFHPEALAEALENSIFDANHVDMLERDEMYFAWDCSGKIFSEDSSALQEKIGGQRTQLKQSILNGRILILTFGTAWGYRHKELDRIVANCHKMPANDFEKQLSSVDRMVDRWSVLLNEIKKRNPSLKVLFTVSPVRHKKDGLVENSRSKARLLELVHQLVENNEQYDYFPSYEIVMDELRDYRFFTEDLVHPNEMAVKYVWEKFSETYFSKETRELMKVVRKINQGFNHRAMMESSANKNRLKALEEEKQNLSVKYPEIYWK